MNTCQNEAVSVICFFCHVVLNLQTGKNNLKKQAQEIGGFVWQSLTHRNVQRSFKNSKNPKWCNGKVTATFFYNYHYLCILDSKH